MAFKGSGRPERKHADCQPARQPARRGGESGLDSCPRQARFGDCCWRPNPSIMWVFAWIFRERLFTCARKRHPGKRFQNLEAPKSALSCLFPTHLNFDFKQLSVFSSSIMAEKQRESID